MAAGDLVTLAQARARCGITDGTDTSDDTLLAELITDLSDWISDYVAPVSLIAETAATYYVDTIAGSVIAFPRGVRAISSLSIATSDQPDDGSGTYTAVTAADIWLRPLAQDRKPGWPATAIVLRGTGTGRLVTARAGAKIVGNFGFATVPARIQEVALNAIAQAYTTRARQAGGVIGEDDTPVAPWAEFFGRGSPQRATLNRFRPGVGIA